MPVSFQGDAQNGRWGTPGISKMPGLHGTLSHPEVLAAVKDLEVMMAFQ
ncbi:hypothetical protein A6R68_09692, partial [Neotoma lepida]